MIQGTNTKGTRGEAQNARFYYNAAGREDMGSNLKSERSFWLLSAWLFALITGANYFPVLLGKIPFPRDMVLQFAAWDGFPRSENWQSYADIGDLITSFYPFRAFAAEAIQQGILPLWNPYFLGGAPFLANPQTSLFYPPNFLYYILSLPTAWTLCFMLRTFLSGMFMTLFVRTIGGSRAGSIFGGIVFALCGFMTAWQGQPMDDSATWLPFICHAVLRLQSRPSRSSLALAALGFAMPVLAGHPETAVHVTFVGCALALATFASSKRDVRFLARFTMAGLLAIGLAAIQIVPTLEWAGQMAAGLDIRWPALPLRQAFGWVTRDVLRGPNSAGIWIPESAAYVGMIVLLVAPFGLFHRNRRHVVFLLATSALAVGAAYGFAPVQWLVNHTPLLAGLKNARLIFVAAFGLAALAGLGISVLEEEVPLKRRRQLIGLALVATAFVLGFILVYKLRLGTFIRVEFTRRPSFSRAMLFVGLVPVLWRLFGGLRGRAFPILACSVVLFDLLTFSYGYTGFAARHEVFPAAPIFEFLAGKAEANPFRIVSMGTPFSPNANIMYEIPSADGYEVGLSPGHRAFSLDYTENRLDGIFLLPSQVLKFSDRRLDLLNVKYLIAGSRSPEFEALSASKRFPVAFNNGAIAAFENQSAMKRAVIVPADGVRMLAALNEQMEALRNPEFDPERTVIVSSFPRSLEPSTAGATPALPPMDAADVTENRINDITLRTSSSGPGVLVLSQTYYPGWKATVDGGAADVFPVDVTLTGIALPAGSHDVRLVFDPFSFKLGAALSLAAAIIAVLCVRIRLTPSAPRS
jgi:hypothetical protein